MPHAAPDAPAYLTTKEVAALLRVKERKVYDLAASGEIPHRRVTGKLLFPRAEIHALIEGAGRTASAERPAVLTGSHDPLLDWAIRESGAGLATLWNGSQDGLAVFTDRQAALTGLHLPEEDGWNLATVSARNLRDCVLVGWARRARGLVLGWDIAGQVSDLSDLRGRRIVRRQPGAGAAALMDRLLKTADMTWEDFEPAPGLARTESDAAAMVSAGEADAALGIAAMARQYRLGFLALIEERYDLLIDRRSYFTAPVQDLLAFAHETAFRERAALMDGYDLSQTGAVRWISP